ncbi:MAG: hypothetical protein J7496_03605 [Novosphingobium sp.]|nr:hypothetical protein [Novosphingobium sp.]MBO9601578.1 hypothetical protein [Novosphingobium sp.]
MSIRLPASPASADSELDRALSLARTPQVPADLAARIVREVTRLPQQPVAPAPPAEVARPSPRHWLRAAGFAALVLVTGAAATLVMQDEPADERADEQVAVASPPALAAPHSAMQKIVPAGTASLAAGPAAAPRAPSAQPAQLAHPAAKGVSADQPAEIGSKIVPTPSAPAELASGTAARAAVAPEKASGLAQTGPVDPGTAVGPLAPNYSPYGPPAGLGISSGGGMPMPEGSAGAGALPRGGGMGGHGGGPLHMPH